MPKIKFIYEHNNFEMIYENTYTIEKILIKYTKLLSVKETEILFLYKGINILENKIFLNKLNNKNNLIMTVINKNKNNNKNINDKGNIICPVCKNLTFLNINEDIIP